MPRFVLLFHDCPDARPRPSHWDLMLEQSELLRTWALERLPRDWAAIALRTAGAPEPAETNVVGAESLGDHRPAYLEVEGTLSGNRGQVTRVEAGTYETREQSPDRWVVAVAGEVLRGSIVLTRQSPDSTRWQLAYEPGAS